MEPAHREPGALPPIELAQPTAPAPPRLPGTVVLRQDADALIDAMLADLAIHAGNCVRAFGDFHLALTSSPRAEPALRRLMYDLSYRDFPWSRTRVWMTEEVGVDEDDPRSCWATLRDLVIETSGVPLEQAHRLDARSPAGALAYESLLREHLGWREKGHDRLDFVLLALHPGGSLGGACAQPEGDALVQHSPAHSSSPARASLTSRLVNGARVVAVFAPGSELAQDVHAVAYPRKSDLPAHMLSARAAELRWYLDHDSARPARA